MITINEKKYNIVYNIARYIYGLYPIITIIIQLIVYYYFTTYLSLENMPFQLQIQFYTVLITQTIAACLGIIILTYSARWGAYLLALHYIIMMLYGLILSAYYYLTSPLFSVSISFDLSSVIIAFSYIMFAMLTEIKRN